MSPIHFLRYGGIFIATAIGLYAVFWLLGRYAGFSQPTGAALIITPMVPAMLEGQFLARRRSGDLPGGEAWRLSLGMTGMVAIISALQVSLLLMGNPETRAIVTQLGLPLFGVIFAFCLLVVLGVNRWFFGLGFRAERKQIEKRAQK